MTNIGALFLRGTQYSAAIPKSQVKNTLQPTDKTTQVERDSENRKILEKKIRIAEDISVGSMLGAFVGVSFGTTTFAFGVAYSVGMLSGIGGVLALGGLILLFIGGYFDGKANRLKEQLKELEEKSNNPTNEPSKEKLTDLISA